MWSRVSLFVVLLFLYISFVISTSTDNTIYVAGNFLETFPSKSGDNIKHAASLVAYEIDTGDFDDDFDGVYISNNVITKLQATENGIYLSGPFSFVGSDLGYSMSVAEYNADDDDFESLNDGIWCYDCVNHITGFGDWTVFAGGFTTLETLNSTVPGIVLMNYDTEQYSPLSDPNSIFPQNNHINSMYGSPTGDYLYIVENTTSTLYRWNSSYGYEVAYDNSANDYKMERVVVSSNGDVYVMGYTVNYNQNIPVSVTQSLYYWAAGFTAGTVPISTIVLETNITNNVCGLIQFTDFENGVLLSIPNYQTNPPCLCYFAYYENGERETQSLNYTIPESLGEVTYLESGINNELWVSVTYQKGGNSDIFYWNSTETLGWILIVTDYSSFTTSAMTYYEDKSSLYVYLLAGDDEYHLIRIKSDDLDVVDKKPGDLSIPGTVNGLIFDPKTNYLYVGGSFDAVGKGHSSTNIAYYSFDDGDWENNLQAKYPVAGLTIVDSTVYIIYSVILGAGDAIPFSAFVAPSTNYDVNNNAPIVRSNGTITKCISSNSTHVFIGGSFTVQFADFSGLAYGLLIYDIEEDSWSTLSIPSTIEPKDSFVINAISYFDDGDNSYIMIGGIFDFEVDPLTFHNIALFNVTSNAWVSVPFPGELSINSLVYMYDSVVIVGGSLIQTGASASSVSAYNISTSTFTPFDGLDETVNALLLYTIYDKDDVINNTSIFAGGNTPYSGISVTNFTDSEGWKNIGNVVDNFFYGSVLVMQYSTGGNGANGINGNDDSSSDWWWITLIVIACVILVVVIVAAIAGGGYVLYKKRAQIKGYEDL